MSDEDQELYDEFGNYIGPDLESSDDDDDDDNDDMDQQHDIPDDQSDVSVDDDDDKQHDQQEQQMVISQPSGEETADPINAIVLHEDKVHYPSAQEVYGDEVRTAVLDEDVMDLETPLVEPLRRQTHHAAAAAAEQYVYTDDYMTALFGNETTQLRRGFALVGHLHAGKTTFMDFLLEGTRRLDTNTKDKDNHGNSPRYLDTLISEQSREMSLVSTPVTAILPDTRGKSYLLTAVDCPGHPQFHDETAAALRSVDGAVIVLDVPNGGNETLELHTELAIRQAVSEGLPLILVLNKIDRCIVELKLPPRDCYFKLLGCVEAVNQLIQQVSRGRYPPLTPQRGNVVFASAKHRWCFTLSSFVELYFEHMDNDEGGLLLSDTHHLYLDSNNNNSADSLARRFWGDAYLDPTTRRFTTTPPSGGVERTFVTHVLRPLYKLYTACLGERESDVNRLLRSVGVLLPKDTLRAGPNTLLREACSRFFQTANAGFVDGVVKHFPSPSAAAKGKIARCYTGPSLAEESKLSSSMLRCDPHGPLMIHITKLYVAPDSNSKDDDVDNVAPADQTFLAFGRVYSGTVRPSQTVRVLGEGYVPDEDEEDTAVATVTAVAIPRGRHITKVTRATAGNWILLEGIDANIAKTATLIEQRNNRGAAEEEDQAYIFRPLSFPQAGGESVMKLAIEPLKPAELPKMVEGLRRISKAYPMARTRVEESGEHVLFGTGELYMDCMMHDLRHVYSDIEVKVADPVVGFRETVIETSSVKCFAEAANKRNKLTFIAEPIDDGLAERLEAGKVNIDWDTKKLGRFFQTQYHWDLLSARSVWAFGSSPTHGTNILLDDTLPSEVDKSMLKTCKSSIVQGFQWATREGPLCEEPVRGTKIKILDAVLADKPIHRGGGQIIPTARKTVHSSLLTATPRLMEPIYRLQIQCPAEIVDAIQPVITRRRGHIVQDKPISGSTLCSVKAFLPVLDSFGFETDLRTYTQGQAMVYSVFDHWAVVPGDPLDKSVVLHPLEPSPPKFLARELLIKTRRRKGLSEDVSINKFFDDAMKAQLAQNEEMPSMME